MVNPGGGRNRFVVPTRWALLEVARGGDAGVAVRLGGPASRRRAFGRRPPLLPVGVQKNLKRSNDYKLYKSVQIIFFKDGGKSLL